MNPAVYMHLRKSVVLEYCLTMCYVQQRLEISKWHIRKTLTFATPEEYLIVVPQSLGIVAT
jgi:hypothetical protein